MPDPALPYRPRLADHVHLRRHLVDGAERIMVHDTQTEELRVLSPRELELLRCADGTRDLGGIVLAAVQRGAYQRGSELLRLLGDLHARGMLTDGIAAGPPRESHPDRPLAVLPGFRLTCDRNGMCCGTYSAVPFTRAEAERARRLVPDALEREADLQEQFLPVQSSTSAHYCAVTMVDGHCPYLAEDGRCRIQLSGGFAAKPRGCQIFPATFVDDGSCVRVSVAVECPCVLASVGQPTGSELVPPGAETEGDLLPHTSIVRLDAAVALTAERRAPRAALGVWSRELATHGAHLADPLAAFWSLADAVRDHGLDVAASLRALTEASAPEPSAMLWSLMALAGRAQAKDEAVRAWRSARDRTRQLAAWLAVGAQSLQDTPCAAARLADGAAHRAHERFYWLATLHGHHLASDSLSLEQALRDRATRLLLARQLATEVPPPCADHPARAHPLTAVESMMRGQGLSAYHGTRRIASPAALP